MLEPSTIVIYVNDLSKSQSFYQALLGINPKEHSPGYTSFTLSNGMSIGLKDRQTVHPKPNGQGGDGELAFTVESTRQADALFSEWKLKGMHIPEPPVTLPFAYTFIALDPDGNRLRVASMVKAEHQDEKAL